MDIKWETVEAGSYRTEIEGEEYTIKKNTDGKWVLGGQGIPPEGLLYDRKSDAEAGLVEYLTPDSTDSQFPELPPSSPSKNRQGHERLLQNIGIDPEGIDGDPLKYIKAEMQRRRAFPDETFEEDFDSWISQNS